MDSPAHNFCKPLLVRKDTSIPPSELEPPFYLVTWGNMANIYLEDDKNHIIDVAMKGGHSQRYEQIADAMAEFEEFCFMKHPAAVHTCISSHYRIPIHSIMERFPPKPPGVSLDPHTMMYVEDGVHAYEDPLHEIPPNIPADTDHTLNNGDHLYPTPGGTPEGSTSVTPLPSRPTSPALPMARANTPEATVLVAATAPIAPALPQVRVLKPIWYLIRLRNNWSFLYANRPPALALLNAFLNRGCAGEFSHGPIPNGTFKPLRKTPAPGETIHYAVRGYYRFGVFLDFDFALEIMSQGVGIHRAPVSMLITTEKQKAKRWSRAGFDRELEDHREELGVFAGEN